MPKLDTVEIAILAAGAGFLLGCYVLARVIVG